MLSLFFLFFAAWYAGKQIDVADYPYVLSTAIPVYFGSVNVALPFLMQLYQIPLEIFDLFIVSGCHEWPFRDLACLYAFDCLYPLSHLRDYAEDKDQLEKTNCSPGHRYQFSIYINSVFGGGISS